MPTRHSDFRHVPQRRSLQRLGTALRELGPETLQHDGGLRGHAVKPALVQADVLRTTLGAPQRLGTIAVVAEEIVEVEVGHAVDFADHRSEEHTSELQSLMRISYAVFCLKKKKKKQSH